MNEPTLTVLHVSECPNLTPMLDRLREATSLPVITREVRTETEAAAWGMAGSPTLLVDGVDPFASSQGCECGLSCRLHRDENGRITPAPTVDQLRAALSRAQSSKPPTDSSPADVLSAWRRRAIPLDPVEKAVHQAILRHYGDTGAPPRPRGPGGADNPGRPNRTSSPRVTSRGRRSSACPRTVRSPSPTRSRPDRHDTESRSDTM